MWELIFLMVILKIPIVYLCLVVWWAVRAEPHPPEPATLVAAAPDPSDVPPSQRPVRPHRPVRGGPRRSPDGGHRAARAAVARAETRR